MPKSVHSARSSRQHQGLLPHPGSGRRVGFLRGVFLHADPLALAQEVYGGSNERLVFRLGLGRVGVGLLEPCDLQRESASTFIPQDCYDPNVDLEAGSYLLSTIQPSRELKKEEALRLTAVWR